MRSSSYGTLAIPRFIKNGITARTKCTQARSNLVLVGGSENLDRKKISGTMGQLSGEGYKPALSFSGFCNSLSSQGDPRTGGAPQLVGLYRIGSGLNFEIWCRPIYYLHGLVASKHFRRSAFKWHNDLLEIIDPETGLRAAGAQPHNRRKFLAKILYRTLRAGTGALDRFNQADVGNTAALQQQASSPQYGLSDRHSEMTVHRDVMWTCQQ